ncbi:hypothetical protein H6P81_001240 [Aristolochia fimbriata]|uniref:Uncharacterized protein n=1 Tax=Aristolochia fimbriata TaxID=158543 RepID=A0AAV7F9L8_ARIFI|nr:hypothetical protein H6P81_001240 [Aristolochia fimbriata]
MALPPSEASQTLSLGKLSDNGAGGRGMTGSPLSTRDSPLSSYRCSLLASRFLSTTASSTGIPTSITETRYVPIRPTEAGLLRVRYQQWTVAITTGVSGYRLPRIAVPGEIWTRFDNTELLARGVV